MKKIQLKKNSLNNFFNTNTNLLEQYLISLGIKEENLQSFLSSPREEDEDNYLLLSNIREAIDIAREELDKEGCNVFIQVDSDTDGWTSSAILIQYLRKRYGNKINVTYKLHPGKEHGINLEVIPSNTNIVFIPDAGSNDFDEQNKLADEGKKVIILDHHHITNKKETKAIIVNNQISEDFDNKNLSGAGVTYLFIKALEDSYDNKVLKEKELMDLAAVGVIADAMDMSSLGNNYLALNGLSEIQNTFLIKLAQHQSRGINDCFNLTKMDVSFYIAPVINGVIRSGSPEDKEIVFKALCENESEEVFESEWRGKKRFETLHEYAVRLATNAKSRQDNGKKKGFELICNKIRNEQLDQNSLIVVKLTEEEEKKVPNNITGLVAMELMKEFNRPCLLLRKTTFNDMEVYGGSGRSGNYHFLPSLLKFLHESSCVEYAEGHDAAFGVFIKEEKINDLINYANKRIPLNSYDDDVQEVDGWFSWSDIEPNNHALKTFAMAQNLWGVGIPKPNFAFTFTVDGNNFKLLGPSKNTIKICDFFLCFKNDELASLVSKLPLTNEKLRMTIIGTLGLNEWNGRETLQVMFSDYDYEVIKPFDIKNLI